MQLALEFAFLFAAERADLGKEISYLFLGLLYWFHFGKIKDKR